ncbi:MAG: acyltransferase, partial [Bacteroidales bacterium]|nr:acyltransferase [Bacteroidales bacterium]
NYFKNFYARRTLRIFPLYFFVLALLFIIIPLISSDFAENYSVLTENQIWFWFYAQNIFFFIKNTFIVSPGSDIINHFWSLSIEEHFYLFWPFIIFFFNKKNIIRVSLVFILIAKLLSFYFVYNEMSWVKTYAFTFTRIDELIVGSMLAVFLLNDKAKRFIEKYVLLIMAISFAIILVFVFKTRRLDSINFINNSYGLMFLVNAVFFSCLIILVMTGKGILHRIFIFSPLRFLGLISYGLYVYHYPVKVLMESTLTRWFAGIDMHEKLALFLIATIELAGAIIVSYVSFRLLEKPFLKLKRLFANE